MSWIKHCTARIGSAAFLVALALGGATWSANAQASPVIWFQNQRLTFAHPIVQKDDIAVALRDPAVQSLLSRLGASVAWQPGERYILVTTAEPRIVSFAIGDTRYDIGDVTARAAFAPYEKNGDVYMPLFALARALYVEPKSDRGDTVLQPQIAVADIKSRNDSTTLVLHGALSLKGNRVASAPDRITYEFPGFGSTLERARKVRANGLSEVDVEMGGTTRSPVTRITLVLSSGANAGEANAGSYHDFTIALSGRGAVAAEPPQMPSATVSAPSAEPATSTPPGAAPASVTAVDGSQNGDGFAVQISVNGNAAYEWHRLLDNRWYVDIHGATLQAPPFDDQQRSPTVTALRVHQLSADTVRVALTLTGQKAVDVSPSGKGLSIIVRDEDADAVARTGSGAIGNGATAYVSPALAASGPSNWKFGRTPAAPTSANPRLIVIDPGHGGSDPGAQNSGMTEKAITLDISTRLRTILLGRGWEVQMTRSADQDVYGPNASDRDELQARVDVANQNGARLFVSVHVNSYSNGTPHGTTTYYYKAEDVGFADAVHRRLVGAALGTKDDGVIKNNFYVVVHTSMPAVLVETAFVSNPDDRSLLRSPEFLQKVAQAIADGIGDYAGPPGSATQTLQR